jgi:hypothetical protein
LPSAAASLLRVSFDQSLLKRTDLALVRREHGKFSVGFNIFIAYSSELPLKLIDCLLRSPAP